jgi:ATP-dependent RNA helicase TDRD9
MNNSVYLQFLTATIDPNDETPRIDKIQYELVSRLIAAFDSKREINRYGRHSEYENISSVRSAVLIFLPGIGEIEAMHKALIDFETNAVHKNYWHILPLHSRITSEEQSRVFQPISSLPPNFRHFRKIILSTNIAESSITVPDITYIIDFCLTKQLTTDTETNFCSLKVIRIIFTSTNLFHIFLLLLLVGVGCEEQLYAAQRTCWSCHRGCCLPNGFQSLLRRVQTIESLVMRLRRN